MISDSVSKEGGVLPGRLRYWPAVLCVAGRVLAEVQMLRQNVQMPLWIKNETTLIVIAR
jgi:hypothetical protein